MNKLKKIIFSSIFISSIVVLERFLSIRTPILTISFSFVPLILSAIILGPKYSSFIAGFGDIIGAFLFPTGSYFFGFSITAFLSGFLYAIFLYRKDFKKNKSFIIRLIFSTLFVTIFCYLGLNTLWLILISGEASKYLLLVRFFKQVIMVPIKIFTIIALTKLLEERINFFLND